MRRDSDGILFYAPIQGETANDLLDSQLRASLSTVIYRKNNGGTLLRSTAILHALIDIRSNWRFLARPALWIPRTWRDAVYDWVAANRHRFFPQQSCALPRPEESRQLLP